MNHLPIDRIEVPIGLVAQLSYYQEGINFNLINRKTSILTLAARKTICHMLMDDVQVNLLFKQLYLKFKVFNKLTIMYIDQTRLNNFYEN